MNSWHDRRILDLFGIDLPILQGPMAGVSTPEMAIAVSEECDGCIAFHARGAARAGATSEQVAEALGVAILMGGGPARTYGPRAWAAFAEFSTGT